MQETSARLRGLKILTGSAKAASSSYVSTNRFDSDANVALDLLAIKPSRADAERRPVEFQAAEKLSLLSAPRFFRVSIGLYLHCRNTGRIKYPRSSKQWRVDSWLRDLCGTSWLRSLYFCTAARSLRCSRQLLGRGPALPANCHVEFGFVDGYAGDKSLLEVEATALAGG